MEMTSYFEAFKRLTFWVGLESEEDKLPTHDRVQVTETGINKHVRPGE